MKAYKVSDRRGVRTEEEIDAITSEQKIVSVQTPKIKARVVPLYDRVLIVPVDQGDERRVGDGTLYGPEMSDEKDEMREGVVIAVGLGRFNENGIRIPMELQPGDHVLFGKWAGSEIIVAGQYFLTMRESEIFSKVIVE